MVKEERQAATHYEPATNNNSSRRLKPPAPQTNNHERERSSNEKPALESRRPLVPYRAKPLGGRTCPYCGEFDDAECYTIEDVERERATETKRFLNQEKDYMAGYKRLRKRAEAAEKEAAFLRSSIAAADARTLQAEKKLAELQNNAIAIAKKYLQVDGIARVNYNEGLKAITELKKAEARLRELEAEYNAEKIVCEKANTRIKELEALVISCTSGRGHDGTVRGCHVCEQVAKIRGLRKT